MTSNQAYALLIGLNALDFLVGVSGLGQRPGLLTAEAPPPSDSNDRFANTGAVAAAENTTVMQKVCGFLSAFRNRSYTSLFFYMATLASFGTIANQFLGYWVQDVLGTPTSASEHGSGYGHSSTHTSSYSLFNFHLTNSAQSATSILIAVSSCANAPSNLIGGAFLCCILPAGYNEIVVTRTLIPPLFVFECYYRRALRSYWQTLHFGLSRGGPDMVPVCASLYTVVHRGDLGCVLLWAHGRAFRRANQRPAGRRAASG